MRTDHEGEEEGIRPFEVLRVLYPSGGKLAVDTAGVSCQVGPVCCREIAQARAVVEFLAQMEDGPEQVGELSVFEQQRVLQQANHEVPVAGELISESRQVEQADIDGVVECASERGGLVEVVFLPTTGDAEVLAQFLSPIHGWGEGREEPVADLAEKAPMTMLSLLRTVRRSRRASRLSMITPTTSTDTGRKATSMTK